MPAKPHMNLVFIGHVDHGKSTTVGRVLYDTGNIDPHELENLKKLAEQLGKATFEFAFVMDQVKEERERGLNGVAAPVRTAEDRVIAEVGIAGPTLRFRGRELREKIALVRETAEKLSLSLGRSGTSSMS